MNFNNLIAGAQFQAMSPHTLEGRQRLAKAGKAELRALRKRAAPLFFVRLLLDAPWLSAAVFSLVLTLGVFFGSGSLAWAAFAALGFPLLMVVVSLVLVRRNLAYLLLRELTPSQALKATELKNYGGPLAWAYFEEVTSHRGLVVADTHAMIWLARESRAKTTADVPQEAREVSTAKATDEGEVAHG